MHRRDILCKLWKWNKYQYSSTNVSTEYIVQHMALEQIEVQ